MKTRRIVFSAVIFTGLLLAACVPERNYDVTLTMAYPEGYIPADGSETENIAEILRSRLVEYGYDNKKIDISPSGNGFKATISGTDTSDLKIIQYLLTARGSLEIWETYENREVVDILLGGNEKLRTEIFELSMRRETPQPGKDSTSSGKDGPEGIDDGLTTSDSLFNKITGAVPLYKLLVPNLDNYGNPNPSCLIGYSGPQDTVQVNKYLKSEEFLILFPPDIRFAWSEEPEIPGRNAVILGLVALKAVSPYRPAVMDGVMIAGSKVVNSSGSGQVRLDLTMNEEGAGVLEILTRNNIDRSLAIVLDGVVLGYPRVAAVIGSGKVSVSGFRSYNKAKALSIILNSGKGAIPAALTITSAEVTAE